MKPKAVLSARIPLAGESVGRGTGFEFHPFAIGEHPDFRKSFIAQRRPAETTVLGSDHCLAIDVCPFPFRELDPPVTLPALELVFVPVTAFSGGRPHFRMCVLAQDPMAWCEVLKDSELTAIACGQAIPQQPALALQAQVVNTRALSAIRLRGAELRIEFHLATVAYRKMAASAVDPASGSRGEQPAALPAIGLTSQ